MKKKIVSLLFLIFTEVLTSCSSVSQKDLTLLNGTWEIEEVQSHGEIFNPKKGAILVDFYKIDANLGYRKKLTPSFRKNYFSSEDRFDFIIEQIEGNFYLSYDNALKPWKEKIVKISENNLELEHSGKTYRYIRHKKISL
tara:strand:+ start:8214 stop:8633 length:420 start_codon:yes stop_codon:yes gene_type:complete